MNAAIIAHQLTSVSIPQQVSVPQQTHHQATPIATTPSQHLPQAFFCRPAEVVAPELIGCLLVKRQADGELLWGLIVEMEAYSQDEPLVV